MKEGKKPVAKKSKKHFIRIIVLVVTFCAVVFGAVVMSDFFLTKDDATAQEPEIVAVTVSGESIILNDDRQVTFDELKDYLDTMEKSGDLFAVALINDTENPADYRVYNEIVDLLREYDIICEKMEIPSSSDEVSVSSVDEG